MDDNRENERNRDLEDTREARRNEVPREEVRRDPENLPREKVNDRETPTTTIREELVPLFLDTEADTFRTEWLNIQGKFVDDPRESVRQANELVAHVLETVTASFSERRDDLERQWNSGENVSTEDLRVALKRYRSFFDRLLTLQS